jgi:sugar phosphate permease
VVFALGAAAFWFSFFHRVAPAAIAADLTASFEVTGAALGALAATYFYVYTVMQVPTGVLADTLGPRRVLTAGGIIAGIGSLLFGVAESIAWAAAGRTLAGLGVSVAFISLLKLNASWFDERRFATTSGLAQVIGITGAFAATAPLAWLVTVVSWRSVFIAVGAASILLALATWWLVRDEPNAGASMDGTGGVDRRTGEALRAAEARWYRSMMQVVKNRATWPCFWVNFGISGSYMSFIGLWAVPYLMHVYGMTAVAASRHTSVMLVAFAVSVACVGAWSDRIRLRRPLIIGSAALYCAFWGAWISGAVPGAATYAVFALMGFIATGFTLSWACAKELNPPSCAGMATGLANTGGFLAAGILQPLVGWVLDQSAVDGDALSGFRPALGVLMLFALIGLAGTLFIRETRCRNIWAPTQQAR